MEYYSYADTRTWTVGRHGQTDTANLSPEMRVLTPFAWESHGGEIRKQSGTGEAICQDFDVCIVEFHRVHTNYERIIFG